MWASLSDLERCAVGCGEEWDALETAAMERLENKRRSIKYSSVMGFGRTDGPCFLQRDHRESGKSVYDIYSYESS